MGFYYDDSGMDAMNRRANGGINTSSAGGGGIMQSKAGRMGMGYATGGPAGAVAAANPNSAFAKADGMYNTGSKIAGAFGPSDPMKGAKNMQGSDDTEFGGSSVGNAGVSGLPGAGSSKMSGLDRENA